VNNGLRPGMGARRNQAPLQRFDYSSGGAGARMGRQRNPALYNDYSANLLRNGQGSQSRSYDYAAEQALNKSSRSISDFGYIDASKQWDPNTKWNCGSSGIKMDADKDEIIGGRIAQPHAFPWMVRIYGGCAKRPCAGALITSKHVLTAYHCTFPEGETEPCDHSDGKRIAVMGQNEFRHTKARGIQMPITGYKYPKNAGFERSTASVIDHDFAMYILKDPIVLRDDILPICLPLQGQSYADSKAVAAGWGKFATKDGKSPWTNQQSALLRRVNLVVSGADFRHTKMLGTVLEGPADSGKGEWQDVCAGDGGGPLMLPARGTERWVIIGTVYGGGYNCETGQKTQFEGEDVGVWNKVSAHTTWILEHLSEDDDDDDDKTTTPRGPFITRFKNGTITLTRPNRTGIDYQPSVAGGGRGETDPSEGADYYAFSNPGPQYGQPYQGAGFNG